jgi:hypothetical protein
VIVAAYLYWPVIYLAVYLPFIVPRLPAWDHVPAAIVATILGGYVALLLAAGRSLAHRRIALHAIGIAVSVDAFSRVMSALRTPAFARTFDGFDPWDALAMVVHALMVLACLEAGRALGRATRARRSVA